MANKNMWNVKVRLYFIDEKSMSSSINGITRLNFSYDDEESANAKRDDITRALINGMNSERDDNVHNRIVKFITDGDVYVIDTGLIVGFKVSVTPPKPEKEKKDRHIDGYDAPPGAKCVDDDDDEDWEEDTEQK